MSPFQRLQNAIRALGVQQPHAELNAKEISRQYKREADRAGQRLRRKQAIAASMKEKVSREKIS